MKTTLFSGALALSLALGGAALAADSPPDPVAGFLNPILSPIGTILDPLGPVADTMAKPITAALPQPAPADAPAAASAPKKHHRRHHRHRHTA